MKAKILILLLLSGLMLGCRSKHKITTTYKENRTETEKVKTDSSSLQNLQSVQSTSEDVSLKESKNEMSGDMVIKGKSDLSNPFVFHNVMGKDTIQSISIMGNAEYTISNHYTKADHKKSEVKREESVYIVQDVAQKAVSKETIKEVKAKVSEETRKVKSTGFEVAAWIFITLIGIALIIVFFIYKYLKK
ncbi:hypothetical protein SAMN05421786_101423 [Chryseobacterium ureilyticum]|uniref:Lipoprotein n=1 Tax=Chryseobacterium ureilyticum TaxID=373668 RepID=A0A1N7KES8_9FLAO|nr:hypothetical protein [Chryseobacterium ureilyticum]SIS60091.1 hypothetical protein SAMN05421786_101423 [Chryseobacterium ureilyticum]